MAGMQQLERQGAADGAGHEEMQKEKHPREKGESGEDEEMQREKHPREKGASAGDKEMQREKHRREKGEKFLPSKYRQNKG